MARSRSVVSRLRSALIILIALTTSVVSGWAQAEKVVDVVEYYNATLDHYFITADPAEIALLDGGGLGGAWQRTGESFAGIIYAHQLRGTIGQYVHDLELMAKVYEPEDIANRIEHLPLK